MRHHRTYLWEGRTRWTTTQWRWQSTSVATPTLCDSSGCDHPVSSSAQSDRRGNLLTFYIPIWPTRWWITGMSLHKHNTTQFCSFPVFIIRTLDKNLIKFVFVSDHPQQQKCLQLIFLITSNAWLCFLIIYFFIIATIKFFIKLHCSHLWNIVLYTAALVVYFYTFSIPVPHICSLHFFLSPFLCCCDAYTYIHLCNTFCFVL